MFEVGFSEILIILGLALIVLGPEKLPKLAAQLGRWTGRARAMAKQLRAQLDQEVNFQEQRVEHGKGNSPAGGPPPVYPPPPSAMPPDPVPAPPATEVAADTADTPVTAGPARDPAMKPSDE